MTRTLAIVSNGVVVDAIIAFAADYPNAIDVTDIDPRPAPGWLYDGAAFSPPLEVAPEPEAPRARHVTNLAFDLRFTEDERIAIKRASLGDTDSALTVAVRLERAAKATFTDLDDAVTRAGVEGFEVFGLIAPGRASEILDAPVQEGERP